MKKSNYDFWLRYHCGLWIGPLTKNAQKEIRASEFAMHLLIPTQYFEQNIKNTNIVHWDTVKKLANELQVSAEMILLSLYYNMSGSDGPIPWSTRCILLQKIYTALSKTTLEEIINLHQIENMSHLFQVPIEVLLLKYCDLKRAEENLVNPIPDKPKRHFFRIPKYRK